MFIHCPAHNLAGKQIFNGCQIQPAFTGLNVSYISDLRLILRCATSELAIEQVGDDRQSMLTVSRRLVLADLLAAQPQAFT